jgi:cystathionine beta-lyase family protein involved in aluminum resistance
MGEHVQQSMLIQVDKDIQAVWAEQNRIVASNSEKVLSAFRKHRVAESDFSPCSGYAYHDAGRDKLDDIYADVFGTEAALVRPQIVSGTHALSIALFAVLRPGDTLVSLTGTPYDTLKKVIQGDEPHSGALSEFGVHYQEADLLASGSLDLSSLESILKDKPKAVLIQRSRGYAWRPSLAVEDIGKIIQACRKISPKTYSIIDNCYGEFTEAIEPGEVGADLLAGSLIKNPGGSLAPSGGYLAGKNELVQAAAYRLTAPGIGGEVGGYLTGTRLFMQGLFMAPMIVGEAMASVTFAARLLSLLGFPVSPDYQEYRADIVQAIELGSPERVVAFCQGIQKASPVDSHVTPMPWDMPGYDHPVIMAAGTFIQGASIELSADAPMRKPYCVYLQGGISRHYSRIAIIQAVEEMIQRGLLK